MFKRVFLSTTSSINGSYSKVKSVLLKIPKTYSFIMQLKIKPIIIQLKVYSRKKLSLTSFINEIRNSSFTMPNSKRKHPSDEAQPNISPLKQTTFLATCHAFCFGTSCTGIPGHQTCCLVRHALKWRVSQFAVAVVDVATIIARSRSRFYFIEH